MACCTCMDRRHEAPPNVIWPYGHWPIHPGLERRVQLFAGRMVKDERRRGRPSRGMRRVSEQLSLSCRPWPRAAPSSQLPEDERRRQIWQARPHESAVSLRNDNTHRSLPTTTTPRLLLCSVSAPGPPPLSLSPLFILLHSSPCTAPPRLPSPPVRPRCISLAGEDGQPGKCSLSDCSLALFTVESAPTADLRYS